MNNRIREIEREISRIERSVDESSSYDEICDSQEKIEELYSEKEALQKEGFVYKDYAKEYE